MSMNNEYKIGQYRFSKNLGNGSFGKVRSKYLDMLFPSFSFNFL